MDIVTLANNHILDFGPEGLLDSCKALDEAGIRLYGGVSGSADEAVSALLAGNLQFNPNVRCSHHDHHGDGHQCGEEKHGCAGNGKSCG